MSQRQGLMLAAVLLATLIMYLRCLGNNFVSDDLLLIVSNPLIGQWSFLWKSLFRHLYWFNDPLPSSSRYRPLLLAWLALNYHLFGLNPAGWHGSGVALHLIAVWLVFKVAAGLTGRWQVALLAALLFALHPVHAEAVVWPASSGLVLSGAFQLAAFHLILRPAGIARRNWALALVLYPGALLSHESAAAFPGLVASYVFLLEDRATATADESAPPPLAERVRRAMVYMAPFALEVVLYLIIRRLVLGFTMASPAAPPNDATSAQVLMTIPRVLASYLLLLAIPWLAGFTYPVVFVRNPASPEFYLPVGALIVLGAAFFLTVRNHPRRRLYLFCAAWGAISLAPMMYLYVFPDDVLVPNGYLYSASVGWCVLVADWALWFRRRSVSAGRLVWAGALATVALYAVVLWNVQHFWHDNLTLATRCIETFPESYRCHVDVALNLELRGDLPGAERELKTALRLQPKSSYALYTIGRVHAHLGRTREAATEIAQALKLRPNAAAVTYAGLAELYDTAGDQAQSEATLQYAATLPAGGEAVGLARARIKTRHGDRAGAEEILRDLAGHYPYDARLLTMLGLLLADEGRNEEALRFFRPALKLSPRDAKLHFFAARALHGLSRDREALDQCRQALAILPADAEAGALMAEIERGRAPR